MAKKQQATTKNTPEVQVRASAKNTLESLIESDLRNDGIKQNLEIKRDDKNVTVIVEMNKHDGLDYIIRTVNKGREIEGAIFYLHAVTKNHRRRVAGSNDFRYEVVFQFKTKEIIEDAHIN